MWLFRGISLFSIAYGIHVSVAYGVAMLTVSVPEGRGGTVLRCLSAVVRRRVADRIPSKPVP